jgi:hypothetical protein
VRIDELRPTLCYSTATARPVTVWILGRFRHGADHNRPHQALRHWSCLLKSANNDVKKKWSIILSGPTTGKRGRGRAEGDQAGLLLVLWQPR